MSYIYAAGVHDALTLLGLTKLANPLDKVLPRGTSLMSHVPAEQMLNPHGRMSGEVADILRGRFNELHAAGQVAEPRAAQAAAHYADPATVVGPQGRARAAAVSPTEATMPAFNLGPSTPGSMPAWMKGPGTSGPLPGKLDIRRNAEQLSQLARAPRGGGTEVLVDPTALSKLPPRMV